MRYRPPKQLFKKRCTRCDEIYVPSGKYNKLCPECIRKMMVKRNDKLKEIAKNRTRRIDSLNRKV